MLAVAACPLVLLACSNDLDAPADAATGSAPVGYSAEITSTVLLDAEAATVLDQLVDYPDTGPAEVTAAIIEIPPGVETGWHFHEVPLFAYVLEGSLTVTYDTEGGQVTKQYDAGQSVLEAIGTHHNGRNDGDVPIRLIAVYMGADGSANTVKL
jgi:quercetin dioxygenase-like cupin family protein